MKQMLALSLGGLLVLVLMAVLGLAGWHWSEARSTAAVREGLLAAVPSPAGVFTASLLDGLPEPARRYFRFAIVEGTPLRAVADLRMHGRIGLGTRDNPGYQPFAARQVLAPGAFVWEVEAGSGLMSIDGSDALVDGEGWTRFWVLGLVPVVRAGGTEDFARSAFGRVVAESVFWNPAALLPGEGIGWSAGGPDTALLVVSRGGLSQELTLTVDAEGRPVSVVIPRWSNANPQGIWQFQPFGGTAGGYRRFGGFTIATSLEGGNFFGTDDYFAFYRAEIDGASFH